MTMQKRLALPLALAASAALALLSRSERRHVAKTQHIENLHAWEGEGGSLLTPTSPQSMPPDSPDPATTTRSQA
jgi:hypothetical protein